MNNTDKQQFTFQCAICGSEIHENSAVAITWHETDDPEEIQPVMAHKSCLASVLHSSIPNNLNPDNARTINPTIAENLVKQNVTVEDAFWITWYYLKQVYDSTGGSFDLSDVLSASEPFFQQDQPADSAMKEYWLEAYKKFVREGIPPLKKLK